MAIKLTGNHSGPLNMRAAFTLNGVHQGDPSDLVRLLRSNESIDRQTRDAIADALERESGIRLEFHRGNEAPFLTRMDTELRYQHIADAVIDMLKKPGAIEKNVKKDVAKQFGVSQRTLETALRRLRRAVFRISKTEG